MQVVRRGLELLDQPFCTNARLQAILVADPATAAGLLRLANSAFFGVSGEIQTVATAIRVVGHRRLRALLQHLVVGKLFETLKGSNTLVRKVRRSALAAGVACYEIGEQSLEQDGDELRVIGLTHNVAEMAIVCEAPELYSLAAQIRSPRARYAESPRLFGAGFNEINALLLGGWRFPASCVTAAENWSRPVSSWHGDNKRYSAAAFVAATFAAAWLDRTEEVEAITRIPAAYAHQLSVDDELLMAAYRRIPDGIRELEELLSPA